MREDLAATRDEGWNGSVTDRLRKWGDWLDYDIGRDEPAGDDCREGANRIEALEGSLKDAVWIMEQYASFISHSVKAADLTMHPYPPELDDIIEKAKALLPPPKEANPYHD